MSNFDPQKDAIGDCFGRIDGLGHILSLKKYDGWICCGRKLALSFCREAEENGLSVPEELPMIAFGSAADEFDPLLRIGSFSSNAEKIGNLVLDLTLQKEFPEPKKYLIPYKWRKGTAPLKKNETREEQYVFTK
jgi:DNA-binding LacI/PurR family transcriptional regulator